MYNKKLFDKICNLNCSYAELEEFVTDIYLKEFDFDNAFNKYYDAGIVISAIEKFKSKECDAKFFACWVKAYNWIVREGFNNEDDAITLKKFIIWEISYWLDSLSSFEDGDDPYDLEEHKNTFSVLDCVLKDIDNCEAAFANKNDTDGGYILTDEGYVYNGSAVVLIVNKAAKYFIKIYGRLDLAGGRINIPKVKNEELQKKITLLQKQGYTELRYGFYGNE